MFHQLPLLTLNTIIGRSVKERVNYALATSLGSAAPFVSLCKLSVKTHDPYFNDTQKAVVSAVFHACASPLVAPADATAEAIVAVRIAEIYHVVQFQSGVRLTPRERHAVVARYRASYNNNSLTWYENKSIHGCLDKNACNYSPDFQWNDYN